MRANLEDNLARRLRMQSPTYGMGNMTLTGSFVIATDGPVFHFLDAGGSTRSVYLPTLAPFGGQQYYVANFGATGNLNVLDADGVAVRVLQPGENAIFFSRRTGWRYIFSSNAGADYISAMLATPRVVTAGIITVTAVETLIIANATTPLTFNLPTVASRSPAGLPLEVYDWSGRSADMTFVPAAGENIMSGTDGTWIVASGGSGMTGGALRLIPVVSLSGWVVR